MFKNMMSNTAMLTAALVHLQKSVEAGEDLEHIRHIVDVASVTHETVSQAQKAINSNQSSTKTLNGQWEITSLLDEDGHLNLYISHADGSEVVDVGEDIGKSDEFGIRLTTEDIEAAHLASANVI
jgi:hypothetical protein